MVNCIFLAHSRKEGERQALCSKEMRTSYGACRQLAVDAAAKGHDLRDAYCSKKQRRAMAMSAFSRIALDYKDSDLGVYRCAWRDFNRSRPEAVARRAHRLGGLGPGS